MDFFSQLSQYMPYLTHSKNPQVWVAQIAAIVVVTVCVNFALMRMITAVDRITRKTKSIWDHALLQAARLPVRLLVWLLGLSIIADILYYVTQVGFLSYAVQVRSVVFILLLALFLIRFIRNAERNLTDPTRTANPVDISTGQAVSKLLRLTVVLVTILTLMGSWGYSLSGLLAFGGIGGIAIGFAAQDTLSNLFGGLMLHLGKPFGVGDWIESPDRNIAGTVEEIGWRLTRIRTFEKRPLYVPNSVFSTILVENPSRMTNRRIYEYFGLRYSDGRQMAAICGAVREMLRIHPAIAQDQTQIVRFNSYGESSLDFMVYCFTHTTAWVEYHAIKEDVLLKIMEIVHAHGADFAFPTRTLQINPDETLAPVESSKAH